VVAADKPGFLEELKRRHVVRVAVAYAVAGWLLVQIATQVFPFFNIPDWAVRLVVILIVIGFPVAMALAWVYEVTPAGIRRTESADSPEARPEHESRQMGRKLNVIIVVALVAAVALLGWRVLVLQRTPTLVKADAGAPAVTANASAPSASAIPTQAVPTKSIAVLPFQNLSDDKKNAYFVAGIQDLILTKLADIGGLKVIARTSTAKYASQPDDLKTIGEQLGVATILEGSVQKQGEEVLVNVQLIDTRTDGHIWAQAYTRTLTNVFGVEGDVAEKIAAALKAELSPAETARLASDMSASPAANNLFLEAEYQANQGNTNYDTASMKAAIPLYQQAIAQAPDFALAYAQLSYTESELAWFGGGGHSPKQLSQQARVDAEHALRLKPDLAAAHRAMGYSDYWGRGDYTAALSAFATALKLNPNDADTLAARGYVERRQGRFEVAITSFGKAIALDPRNSALVFELGVTYMQANRYDDAEGAFQRSLALDPHNINAMGGYSNAILYSTGDVARALAAIQGDDPQLQLNRVFLLTYQRKYKQALALLDSVPDTPDYFNASLNGPKSLQQADLYRLIGDRASARPLYAQSLAPLQATLKTTEGINQAFIWQSLANVQLELGHTSTALDAVAKSQQIAGQHADRTYRSELMEYAAALYARAQCPDLAVPLLATALTAPGIGEYYSPPLLWLDPAWDPIRHDPAFQALLKQYAKYKPAVIPAVPASS
jgi:TolB-like protein/cytochrome c-type biogenesis protein CcmH/NrfG